MIDVQICTPEHCIPIERVGITSLKLPIYIKDKETGVQHSVADIDVFVDLPATEKGTHMSRLAIGVQKFIDRQLSLDLITEIAEYIRVQCNADTCELIYKFPYFIKKNAPVSKEPGFVHYNIAFNVVKTQNDKNHILNIEIITTSLCPCSKEISDNGAHNQRSSINIKCQPNKWIWLEDIINIAEQESSCQIYSTLKRPDEKYVTEYAYNHPKFVEDMVRAIYTKLSMLDCFDWFEIEVSNKESIHQHNAYAKMSTR